jgi:hypothetical protein
MGSRTIPAARAVYLWACKRLRRTGRGAWRRPMPSKVHPRLMEWYGLPGWLRAEAVAALRQYERETLHEANEHALRDPVGWPAIVAALCSWPARETLARVVSRESVDWDHHTPAAVAVAAGIWPDPMVRS